MHIQVGVVGSMVDGGGLVVHHCEDEYEALQLVKTILGGITRGKEYSDPEYRSAELSRRDTDHPSGPIDVAMYDGARLNAVILTPVVRTIEDVINPKKRVQIPDDPEFDVDEEVDDVDNG